ncbi:uncharacterized protein [Haliotis cracherodii]|uniref:uncharacterized protein n=1 Tax=Haliotis cracherodii TaxID=6455 RepID=UPI0039EBD0B5
MSMTTEEAVAGDAAAVPGAAPNGAGTAQDDPTGSTVQYASHVTENTSDKPQQDSAGPSGERVFGEGDRSMPMEDLPGRLGEEGGNVTEGQGQGQVIADQGNNEDPVKEKADVEDDKSNDSNDTLESGDSKSKGLSPVVVPAVDDITTVHKDNLPSSQEHTVNGLDVVSASNRSGGAEENITDAVREMSVDSAAILAGDSVQRASDERGNAKRNSADAKACRRKTPTSSESYPTMSTAPPSRLPLIRSAHAHIQSLQAPNAPRGFEHKQMLRSRVPPRFIRLATVTMTPKAKTVSAAPSLYYEEPRRPTKMITWEEANNARPPLRFDMEGPSPWTYSPRNKPLYETNAPAWTFGARCSPEREGGSRTSWAKTWFQTPHVWHTKVDFVSDGTWPTPNLYKKGSLLGPRQRTMPESPSYSMGRKGDFSITKQGAAKEPSPGEYDTHHSDRALFRRHPAYSHQFRREGTILWSSAEDTPGPGSYTPTSSTRPHGPAFSIQGIRREKSHVLGPYSSF